MIYKQRFAHQTQATIVAIIRDSFMIYPRASVRPEAVTVLNASFMGPEPKVPLLTFTFLFFMASFLQG